MIADAATAKASHAQSDHLALGQDDPRLPPSISANFSQTPGLMGPPALSNMSRTPYSQTLQGQLATQPDQQAEPTRREPVSLP